VALGQKVQRKYFENLHNFHFLKKYYLYKQVKVFICAGHVEWIEELRNVQNLQSEYNEGKTADFSYVTPSNHVKVRPCFKETCMLLLKSGPCR
jgi:hypothetical protein